jgi:hypothetical protein
LWLAGITHTGLSATPAISLPEVTFTGIQLPNRVDGIDRIAAMNWWRIQAVQSETGGELAVTYSGPDCSVPGNVPSSPDANTKRCQPVRWQPDAAPERLDWFHRYVVTAVTETDRTTGLVPVVTSYEYVGAPAWAYAKDDGLTKDKYRTWSQWRGYQRVRTRKGNPQDGRRSLTDNLYLRGMDGDRLASGGSRSVTVTASDGTAVKDDEALAGFLLEGVVDDGDGGAEVSASVNVPWLSAPTATAVHPHRAGAGHRQYPRPDPAGRRHRPADPGGHHVRHQRGQRRQHPGQ